MREFINIVESAGNAELEEGLKSALAAGALGVAALGGYHAAATTHHDSSAELAQAKAMTFSPKAERVAKAKGFDSAAAMYLWMRNQKLGKTTGMKSNAEIQGKVNDATMMHPAKMIGFATDAMRDATD